MDRCIPFVSSSVGRFYLTSSFEHFLGSCDRQMLKDILADQLQEQNTTVSLTQSILVDIYHDDTQDIHSKQHDT